MKKRGKKKENFLKKQYKESWKYIKESRNYIFIIVGIFLIFSVIGFLFPVFFVEQIQKLLQELIDKTAGLSMWQMILFIFFNNLQSSFVALVSGIVLGVFPILSGLINGYVLGFVGKKSVEVAGGLVLLRLLPHGIFELPAIFLSMALGVKLGMVWFSKKSIKSEFVRRVSQSLKIFLLIILPLLVIAAIIEGVLIFVLG